MEEIILIINSLLDRIGASANIQNSNEWYLAENLKNYKNKIESSKNSHEIYKANFILRRFLIDSMDWGSPEAKICSELLALGDQYEKELKQCRAAGRAPSP